MLLIRVDAAREQRQDSTALDVGTGNDHAVASALLGTMQGAVDAIEDRGEWLASRCR